MTSPSLKKIIWSVNILEDVDSHKNMLTLLRAVTRETSARIEPVFILSAPYANPVGTPKSDYEQAYLALAEKRLLELKRTCGLDGIEDGKILINHQGTVRKDVEMLASYARSRGADALAVSTHGRRGAPRFFMGSFAETLLLTANMPVFSVNPQSQVNEKIRKILVPTDFFARSESTLEKVLALGKAWNATVTLFYKEPYLVGAALNPEVYNYIAEETKERQATAEQWKSRGEKLGVKVNILIDEKPGYLSDAIEDLVAKDGFDLIAMGTQADGFTALVAGSAARQTVRQATCPVWVTRINEVQ